MPFNGETTTQQINQSMNSMLLLHASCQAIIEVSIEQVDSPWYSTLDQELGEAENLVIGWRQNGFLYFHQDILDEIISSGQSFLDSSQEINALFTQLENNFSETAKAKLIADLSALEPPIKTMTDQIAEYLSKLKVFEQQMQKPHSEMNKTIAQVQAEEQDIQSEIAAINSQIASLQKQIQADRKAIAAAKKARTKGIVETIFGVLLAPVTGGASLILAGIGVASISEAESKISSMQSTIGKYQQKISGDQKDLTRDQKTVATLNGLSMSTEIAIDDLSTIDSALDSLRMTWDILQGELEGETQKLDSATTAKEIIVSQAWYNAACEQWDLIVSHTTDLNNRTISSTNVTIG